MMIRLVSLIKVKNDTFLKLSLTRTYGSLPHTWVVKLSAQFKIKSRFSETNVASNVLNKEMEVWTCSQIPYIVVTKL